MTKSYLKSYKTTNERGLIISLQHIVFIMRLSTKKRIYIITSLVLLGVGISGYGIYLRNRSAHNTLVRAIGITATNPQKALAEIEQINRQFLSGTNYMLCDLLKAAALVSLQEYTLADSLLKHVSPYFKYKGDSLRLAEIYYYKGEIARNSNFLLEAVEYFTLCTQYNNGVKDLTELYFYLDNFKGKAYHIKRMKEEERTAKLAALKLAKELKDPRFLEEAYSGLSYYYADVADYGESIPVLKEAAAQRYTGSLQTRLLFLLSEKYANNRQFDSAQIYARQIPSLYQDSIDYLLGKIYFNLHRIDSARMYLNRSSGSSNPAMRLKAFRQLLNLNISTGSMSGVSGCLEKLVRYREQVDSIGNNEMLAKIEDVERLRKTIRDSESEEVKYYQYWILYFWIMVGAFFCILVLLSVTIILQKKKKNLQLKRQQARLDALKMQIDPHFIFNNLSILLDLVETGDKTAASYVQALSKVYRHIVSNVDKNLSSVENELSCLENYIFLLKIRFGNAIQIDIQVEDAVRNRQTPPVVLQMLLENAIKHNRASEESPLFIRVYSKGNNLVVENNRKPIASSGSNHHIGLRNIKERYLLIGAPAPEIYEDENMYRITISTL